MIQSSTREREVTRAKDIVSVLSDACYRLSAEHLMRRRTVLAPGTFFFVVKKISTKTESIQTNIFLGVSCKGNYLEILDTGKTPCQSAIINYLSFLVNNYRPKSFFFYWKKVMYLSLCTQPHAPISKAFYSHKLFYLT